LEYKTDRIRADVPFRDARDLILRPIGEFDIFVSRAREVVFSNINPSIGDVIDIGKDRLVDHHLIVFTRVTNGIDRAFGRRPNCRDAHIH
jgi:hypothetical protein